MFRMIRTATLKNASYTPKAIGWSTELTSYMNDKYDMDMKVGLGVLNKLEMFWVVDFENMAAIEETWGKMLQDTKYWEMVENAKDFWVDGSLEDKLVSVLN